MKKIWKWLLGLLIVVVVAAGLFGAGYAMRRAMLARYAVGGLPQPRPGQLPAAPRFEQWEGRSPHNWQSAPNFKDRQKFSHFGGQRMPFGPFGLGFLFLGMLFRALVPLAFGGLLLFGAYQLGKRAGARSALNPAPVSTPAPTEGTGEGPEPVG